MANDCIAKVDEILRTAQGNPLDIYAVLYREHLSVSTKPSAVLQQILQFSSQPIGSGDDDAPELMNADQERKLKRDYFPLVKGIILLLVKKNLPPEEFYQNLYHRIFVSDLFPDDELVKIVLLRLLAEDFPEIPYFQAVGLLPMTNEDYQAAAERVDSQVIQALHMLNRNFDSRTEEASQLCRLATEILDPQDQIVYWAVVVSILKEGMRQQGGPVG